MIARLLIADYTSGTMPAWQPGVVNATGRTVIGPLGRTVQVPANTAAFEHDPATGACLGLSLNPGAVQYLDDWGDPGGDAWVDNVSTVGPASGAIWGLFSYIEIVSGGATWNRRRQTVTGSWSAGDKVTISLIYAAGGGNSSDAVRIVLDDVANDTLIIIAGDVGSPSVRNDDAGTVSNDSTLALADGWYWYRATVTLTQSTTELRLGLGPNSITTGETVLFAAANLVSEIVPSSFIAGPSRAADVVPDYFWGDGINSGAFVVGVDLPYGHIGDQPIVRLRDADNSDLLELRGNTSANYSAIHQATTSQAVFVGPSTLSGPMRMATSFSDDDFAASFDGGVLQGDTSGTAPTVTGLAFPEPVTPVIFQAIEVWSGDISDADLQRLSLGQGPASAHTIPVGAAGLVYSQAVDAAGAVQGQQLSGRALAAPMAVDAAGLVQAQVFRSQSLGFPLAIGAVGVSQAQALSANGLAHDFEMSSAYAVPNLTALPGMTRIVEQL